MEELIKRFNENDVRYLLIGGQAMRLEGMPRFSMDWDFYIPPRDRANIDKINRLLGEDLDMPLLSLGTQGENFVQTYQTQWGIVQFHLGGVGLPDFNEAEERSVTRVTEAGVAVRCISGIDLLESKKKANRPEDQMDIKFLEKKKAMGLL